MWTIVSVDLVFTEFSFLKIELVGSSLPPSTGEGSSHSPLGLFVPHNETAVCISEALGIVAKMGQSPATPPRYVCITSMLCERI